MPSFDIVKECDIDKTYRVARIMGDYDVKLDHAKEHFIGNIELPEDWQIGVIWQGHCLKVILLYSMNSRPLSTVK